MALRYRILEPLERETTTDPDGNDVTVDHVEAGYVRVPYEIFDSDDGSVLAVGVVDASPTTTAKEIHDLIKADARRREGLVALAKSLREKHAGRDYPVG